MAIAFSRGSSAAASSGVVDRELAGKGDDIPILGQSLFRL